MEINAIVYGENLELNEKNKELDKALINLTRKYDKLVISRDKERERAEWWKRIALWALAIELTGLVVIGSDKLMTWMGY